MVDHHAPANCGQDVGTRLTTPSLSQVNAASLRMYASEILLLIKGRCWALELSSSDGGGSKWLSPLFPLLCEKFGIPVLPPVLFDILAIGWLDVVQGSNHLFG